MASNLLRGKTKFALKNSMKIIGKNGFGILSMKKEETIGFLKEEKFPDRSSISNSVLKKLPLTSINCFIHVKAFPRFGHFSKTWKQAIVISNLKIHIQQTQKKEISLIFAMNWVPTTIIIRIVESWHNPELTTSPPAEKKNSNW